MFCTTLTITGLAIATACYRYVRIFNAWTNAFAGSASGDVFVVALSDQPFYDAYRHLAQQSIQHRFYHHRLRVAIACNHYASIFSSWTDAFAVFASGEDFVVALSGQPFDDAYRCVDC